MTDAADRCTLCDLPTPDPPVTDADGDVAGAYCCRGCLEVARRLDDPAEAAADPAASLRSGTGTEAAHDAGAAADDGAGGDVTPPADAAEAFVRVDGMHCGTCEAFVESRAKERPDVYTAEASYAADLCRITYDEAQVGPETLAEVVSGLGYEAHLVGGTDGDAGREAGERDGDCAGVGAGEDASVGGRLLLGVLFGMMVMVWYALFFYPAYLGVDESFRLFALEGSAGDFLRYNVWVMTSLVLFYTGYPILRGAYVSLRAGHPNMDLLVSLAAGTAYLYSAIATLLGRPEVYFDITVAVVLVVTVGDLYKERVKRSATDRLTDLTRNRVRSARRRVRAEVAAPDAPSDRGRGDGDGAGSRAAQPVGGTEGDAGVTGSATGVESGGGGGTATETVPVEELAAGDEVVVRPGERIPVDGTVAEGTAAIDESLVTGESTPVGVEPGSEVVGGAVVADGGIVVTVGEGAESTLDRLLRRLWAIQSSRPGAQRLADRLAAVFVPLVVTLAVGVTGYQALTGTAPADALLTGLAVLVVSCPCALGLATPLAVAAGVREAIARGVVVADESVFERATDTDTVVFDKTGTLTTGESRVERVVTDVGDGSGSASGSERGSSAEEENGNANANANGSGGEVTERTLLARAAAVEQFADHPLAGAIVDAAPAVDAAVREFERYPGSGVGATVALATDRTGRYDPVADGGDPRATDATDPARRDGGTAPGATPTSSSTSASTSASVSADADADADVADRPDPVAAAGVETIVGRPSLFAERGWTVPEGCRAAYEEARASGSIPALVGWDGAVHGLVVAGDEPRPTWRSVLDRVADGDRRVVVLTGDDGAAADRFRGHPAVDEVFAGVPPEGKAETVDRLARRGTVAMVGDGSNDAPALAAADLGIAMGSGTELAADAAEVVVTGGLTAVPAVFEVTAAARRRVRENLGWAFVYNAVAVPLAVVGLVNPLFAALAMSASSLLVVANSARAFDVPAADDGAGSAPDGERHAG
jgi:Cu2+-exporting ATPase